MFIVLACSRYILTCSLSLSLLLTLLFYSVETEYAEKYEQMQQRHLQEFEAVGGGVGGEGGGEESEPATQAAPETETTTAAAEPATTIQPPDDDNNNNISSSSKLEKARRKREKQKEQERQKDAAIRAELETVTQSGPSARDAEMAAIQAQLEPLGLCIATIPADGHCLYRAVQAQLLSASLTTTDTDTTVVDDDLVWQMRETCANAILDQGHDLEAFLEFTDNVPDLQTYVNRVRTRADCWGGHVELRALSTALQRPIHVYQAAGGCLVIDDSHGNASSSSNVVEPIRLSYHLRYYSLGEHYNQVIAKK
jgi:OTU domain-containing protein 6